MAGVAVGEIFMLSKKSEARTARIVAFIKIGKKISNGGQKKNNN